MESNDEYIEYLPIESHGIIGNMRTTALVGTDGRIDWFPFPRVDGSPIFASILDFKKGGQWTVHPLLERTKQYLNGGEVRYKQYYWPDTNVLVTRFSTEDGVVQVVDYMTVRGEVDNSQSFHKPQVSCYPQRLSYMLLKVVLNIVVRKISAIRGTVKMYQCCAPAFDFGRKKHSLHIDSHKAQFSSQDDFAICVSCSDPSLLRNHDNILYSEFTLKQGCCAYHSLRQECQPVKLFSGPELVEHEARWFHQTTDYWRSWLTKCTYNGRWREKVYRSALTLKLLCVSESGSIVAAPTTSLPEFVGGERNWDYRFTWIRDAAFTLYALLRIGFTQEAQAFMCWLEARATESEIHTRAFPLQIMYGVDGRSHLVEEIVDNLSGYMGSEPVRIGNGAYNQLQLDIYGELMDSVYLFNKFGVPISFDLWVHLTKMIDWVCDNWTQKDEGLWEVRGGKQHFVYSKVLCWVAVDRGLRLAEKRSLPCPSRRKWIETRDKMYKVIMVSNFLHFLEIQELGWSEHKHSFVQAFDSDQLDASVLIMPLVLFLSGTEPKFLATLDAIMKPPAQDGLVVDDCLVFRYDTNTKIDGLTGLEGTFNMCSLWLIEALTRSGKYDPSKLQKAQLMFEEMLGYANHLGLYAEETGPRGEQLGNFPQAFTHIALISTAFNLDRALNLAE